jgi:uncharacterized protein (TIGR02217 family)
MAYDRLNLGINYGTTSTLKFKTEVLEDGSGNEQRNPKWNYPLWVFDIGDRDLDKAGIQNLIAFFMKVKGRLQPFLWKNWTDYQAINQVIGVGNGAITTYQLVKTYGTSNPMTIPITKPIDESVSITVNGIISTAWSVNADTGIITFSVAPTGQIVANFEFDYLVRSSIDSLNSTFKAIRLDNGNTVYAIGSIALEQIRD